MRGSLPAAGVGVFFFKPELLRFLYKVCKSRIFKSASLIEDVFIFYTPATCTGVDVYI